MLKFNTDFVLDISKKEILNSYRNKVAKIFSSIQDKTAKGVEMCGWINWIFEDHSELFLKIQKIREKWIDLHVKNIVIIGTGGSYIGAKAALNFVHNKFQQQLFNFIFVPSFSERYLYSLIKKLKNEKFAIVVISKSGNTLESAVAFRILREELFKKEKEKYNEYIISITDKCNGKLKEISDKNKFITFEIKDDIGGRYSALTSVGLVPVILSGIDGKDLIFGAQKCYKDHFHCDIDKNTASQYAAYRNYFFENENLKTECIIAYEKNLDFTLEKMKQLFAESEGKNKKGVMPVLYEFTPDLHSVGQLLQDGPKNFFETTILVSKSKNELKIEKSNFNNDDGLDWLNNKTLHEINKCAFLGTVHAHKEDAKINNIVIELENWEPYTFGYFYYWICLTAMFSAYLFEQNPFDQPGVEAYKNRMFSLLKDI